MIWSKIRGSVILFLHEHHQDKILELARLVAVRAPHFVINHPRCTDELLLSTNEVGFDRSTVLTNEVGPSAIIGLSFHQVL